MIQTMLDSLKRLYVKSELIKNKVEAMLSDGILTQEEYDYITSNEV